MFVMDFKLHSVSISEPWGLYEIEQDDDDIVMLEIIFIKNLLFANHCIYIFHVILFNSKKILWNGLQGLIKLLKVTQILNPKISCSVPPEI